MPFHMASKVSWHRRLPAIVPSPTMNMRLLSPNQPSSVMMVTSDIDDVALLERLVVGDAVAPRG
jgi:hypothetical protein